MAVTWGEAEVQMHIDGTALPGEVTTYTRQAATQGGQAFEKQFNKVMRGIRLTGFRNFGRAFGRMVATIVTSSGAFRIVSRDLRVLGQALRGGVSLALGAVAKRFRAIVTPIKELNFEVRNESAKTWQMLREGARELTINMDDLKDTFPGVVNGIRGVGRAFNAVRSEVKGFGTAVRDDANQTTTMLREGMSKLKISLDDVKDTFPGVTRAVNAVGRGFTRVRDVALVVGRTMKELGPDFAEVRTAANETGNAFTRLRNRLANVVTLRKEVKEGLAEFKTSLDTVTASSKETTAAVGRASSGIKDFVAETDKGTASGRSFFSAWKRMPHGLRQVVVWTTAIIGAMEQLATLSSAAGGGLLVFAGAFTQIGIGTGATIAAFQDLNDELEELPGWLRPAAAAFQGIGTAFSEMQDEIQKTALKDAVGDFDSLAGTVRALIPAFQPLAEVISRAIGGLADGLKPGTEAFANLETLIKNSAPTFETFLRIAGKLGDALLAAFADPKMQKAIDGFMGWIEDMTDSFSTFVKSDEFGQWLDDTMRVMRALGGLLEETGRMLNRLVTPETVERTETFLNNMEGAMPFLERILAVFGELDVFGLVALGLQELGQALSPILAVLEPVAAIIRDVLIYAFEGLDNAAGMLATTLLPLRLAFEFLQQLVEKFLEKFAPIQKVVEDVNEAFQEAADKVFEALAPAFDEITTAIAEMLPSPKEFERFLREELIPAIDKTADWIIEHVVPALQDLAFWIETEAVPAAKVFWDFLSTYIIPALRNVWIGLGILGDAFFIFAGVVKAAINTIKKPIEDAIGWLTNLIKVGSGLAGKIQIPGGGGGNGRGYAPTATGGLFNGPSRRLIGEAGPEAVVPLNRALSQVDPSVRWLSAIAQGKNAPMASGGIVGGGKSLTIAPGAIQVVEVGDGRRSANDVMQRLVEYAVG